MKQDQDLRTIIASHEAELTDMERDIAQYFFIIRSTTALPVLFSRNGVTPCLKGSFNAFLSKMWLHWLSGICLSL